MENSTKYHSTGRGRWEVSIEGVMPLIVRKEATNKIKTGRGEEMKRVRRESTS